MFKKSGSVRDYVHYYKGVAVIMIMTHFPNNIFSKKYCYRYFKPTEIINNIDVAFVCNLVKCNYSWHLT